MPDPRPTPSMVNFRAHELNTGSEEGAWADFEAMIAQLADALYPGARRISANPGDGGIDVFRGHLDDRIWVWQSKYFMPRVGQSQRRQIKESFDSAQRNARASGYRIDRWILCVPSSMDLQTALWWANWKRDRETETATKICVWDETGLRRRLGRPEAFAVVAAFYPPPGGVARPAVEAGIGMDVPAADLGWDEGPGWPGAVDRQPRGGDTVRLAGRDCLLQGDPEQRTGGDAWVLRTGAAIVMDAPSRPVWFRQVLIRRPDVAADAQAAAIAVQAGLLEQGGGRHGLPQLVERQVSAAEAAILFARPAGRTWREVFGPVDPDRSRPLDRVTAVGLLVAAERVAGALSRLHDAGHSHRALMPDGVIITGASGLPVLRDLGLAGVRRHPGEGPVEYRAPEQERVGFHQPEVGSRTDVYRLAAMTYHCLTGRAPGRLPAALRAFGFDVPADLDEVLLAALHADPDRRPARPDLLVPALRAASRQLARAGY